MLPLKSRRRSCGLRAGQHTMRRGMWALYLLIAWMLGWIAWQQSGVGLIIRDPYPFGFVLFLSNLIQLWALPAILVGQNVLAAHADLRATADHETLELLHAINTTRLEILRKLQRAAIPGGRPPRSCHYESRTRPHDRVHTWGACM